jgi:hypothetical protein
MPSTSQEAISNLSAISGLISPSRRTLVSPYCVLSIWPGCLLRKPWNSTQATRLRHLAFIDCSYYGLSVSNLLLSPCLHLSLCAFLLHSSSFSLANSFCQTPSQNSGTCFALCVCASLISCHRTTTTRTKNQHRHPHFLPSCLLNFLSLSHPPPSS